MVLAGLPGFFCRGLDHFDELAQFSDRAVDILALFLELIDTFLAFGDRHFHLRSPPIAQSRTKVSFAMSEAMNTGLSKSRWISE